MPFVRLLIKENKLRAEPLWWGSKLKAPGTVTQALWWGHHCAVNISHKKLTKNYHRKCWLSMWHKPTVTWEQGNSAEELLLSGWSVGIFLIANWWGMSTVGIASPWAGGLQYGRGAEHASQQHYSMCSASALASRFPFWLPWKDGGLNCKMNDPFTPWVTFWIYYDNRNLTRIKSISGDLDGIYEHLFFCFLFFFHF